MTLSLNECLENLALEVSANADMMEDLEVYSFFDVFSNYLIEAGEIDTADRCYFSPDSKGSSIRIDGYGGDPIDTDNRLNIIVCDYSKSKEIENVNKANIEGVCKRAANFISKCQDSNFRISLDSNFILFFLGKSLFFFKNSSIRLSFLFFINQLILISKKSSSLKFSGA